MQLPRSVRRLMSAFEKLPGIGPKTAQRLSYYLLNVPQAQLDELSQAVAQLKRETQKCSICYQIAETDPCPVCSDSQRDSSIICVVEQPLEVIAIEQTQQYHGVYHVLHGVLDPLNYIGPEELYLAHLLKRITTSLDTKPIREIIMALNHDLEGEATVMYLKQEIDKLKQQYPQLAELKITRLAQGVPLGGELEYLDQRTLSQALVGRQLLE